MILNHLTVMTGHVTELDRSTTSGETIDALRAVIDAESGAIPGPDPGYWVDLVRPIIDGRPVEGGAAFTVQLGRAGAALAHNVVCWRPEHEAMAWSMIETIDPKVSPRPIQKPPMPWLATTFLDGLISASWQQAYHLAAAERDFAWALIETPL